MISINFDGIQEFTANLDEYAEALADKGDEFCEKLCEFGEKEADERFGQALYSGLNDVEVHTETSDDGCSVVAEGKSLLFIEYGTGINNAEHTIPTYHHGTYGKGNGANEKGWVYRGYEGNNGYPFGKGKVFTKGEPANECMYQTSLEMQDNAMRIAREVFKND